MRLLVSPPPRGGRPTSAPAPPLYTCYTDYRALAHYSITGIAQAAKKLRDGGDPAPDMLDLIISIDDIQQAIEDELRKHIND